MNIPDDEVTIALHIFVTHLVPEMGSARFVFKAKSGPRQGEPKETEVPIFIPYQVLESFSNILPKVLADMRAAGCDQLYAPKPQHPNA